MAIFTVTSRGEQITFESNFTFEQALDACRGLRHSTFAQDLVAKSHRLSDLQKAWVHKLAVDASKPADTTGMEKIDAKALFDLFDGVANKLRYPKLTYTVNNGDTLVLSIAGNRSRCPGSMNVASNRRYGEGQFFGRINRDGTTTVGNPQVVQYLKVIAENPVHAAVACGKMTGHCVFCTRELTDGRSVTVGYGPICADKWSLPWGECA